MAALLDDEAAVAAYHGDDARRACSERLDRLAAGFAAMRADGLPGRGDRAAGGDLPVGAGRDAGPDATRRRASSCSTKAGLRGGAVPGLRAARGQRLVPHLGRRRLARRDRRRASRACGPRCRGADVGSSRHAAASRSALAIVLARLAAVPVRREQARRRADARAHRRAAWSSIPASAADPRTYCQFGPLHTTLMRPFIALDPVAPRSSRYLSLLAGIAVLFPVPARSRAGWWGRGARRLAAFALAVSPLHIQASTTAASEALYLLLWVVRARAAAGGARRARRRCATFAARRAARVAGGGHPLRRLARAADRRCWRRWSSARRDRRRSLRRAWRCSRSARRRCRWRGSRGARARAAIRSSSRTTS